MKYLAVAGLALFLVSPAQAQQGPGTDTTAPMANQPATPAPTGTMNKVNANEFMTNEAPNAWLVGNLWNKSVYNQSGKQIGDLKDVLIAPDGKIQALVIGVGGFLGLGEKNVAVDYNYLEKNGSIKPNRITLNMTEQELRSAPTFNRTNNANK
ncbi:MAG: PRC-barrel domain-containing protein [Rhodomicrobium sp.]